MGHGSREHGRPWSVTGQASSGPSRRGPKRDRHRLRPALQVLEGRRLLATFTVTSTNSESLARLSGELSGSPGVGMVAPFGNSLHVSGSDAAALEAAIAPYRDRPGLVWQRAAPSLEDVFIDLMGRARDNFQ